MEHHLFTGKRILGRGPLKGSRTRYGTNARCACGEWTWSTNEYPPSRGGVRDAKQAHARHLKTTTVERDIEITERALAAARERVKKFRAQELFGLVEMWEARERMLSESLELDRAKMSA